MKNALILHALNSDSRETWIPWLKDELEKKGFKVWTPDLPNPGAPDPDRWSDYIFKNWRFDGDSIVIGRSVGAVEILHLLERIPEGISINKAIMVAAFLDDLGRPALTGMFNRSFDFEKIKKSAKEIILIHSDNDPAVPFKNAELLEEKTGGRLIMMKGQGHFNLEAGEKYLKFPELLDLI